MGKKIPLLISTLTLLVGTFTPMAAWAEDADELSSPLYERTSWTYEEMSALNAEIQPEIDANCSGDPMCQDMYIGMNKAGDIYRALGHYREHGLTITAINPHQKSIRVAYNADILTANYPERVHLKDLYMAQVEKDHYGSAAALEYGGEEAEHLNELFVRRAVDNDENWFPADEEMEISIPNFTMSSDTLGDVNTKQYQDKIELFYRMAGSNSSWGDRFDYGDCLNSLEEDMECRIMYRKDTYYYAPVKIARSVTNATEIELVDTTEDGYGGNMAESSPQSDAISTTVAENTTPVNFSTPDTGAPTIENHTATAEFQWWLGVIFAVGLATLLWLFWPTRRESSKKPRK